MGASRILCLALLAASFCSASAEAAGFRCSASAARVTVLGQAVEPVTANAGTTACASDSKTLTGAAAGFTGPLTIGALIASTEVFPAKKSVVATGGIADLRVAALPSLPIALPQVSVPAAAQAQLADALTTTIDLGSIKAAIPAVPDVVQNTANLNYNTLNAVAIALGVLVPLPTNLMINPGDALPSSTSLDATATLNTALNALLPNGQLPTTELLRVQGAVAYAAGACKEGEAFVSGSSDVSGIGVFGQNLPVGTVADQVLTLINSGDIDPSNIDVSSIDLGLTPEQEALIAGVPAAQAALQTLVDNTVQDALDALGPIHVLDPTVAQVKVTPGVRFQDATSVTQRALTVVVSIAGRKIVEAVVGEARASSAGVDCSAPVTDPGPAAGGEITVPGFEAPIDTGTPEGAALQCSTRRLVLVDVLERDNRVKLTGVADPALAGKRVGIVFEATGDTVAHALVARDGSFDTTAPLPPERLRDTNDARYMAKLGKEESINLKLRRRMVIRSMTAQGRRVTITGRVLPPLGEPREPITLSRRVSCTQEKVVTRFTPRPDGRFRVTVNAPKGLGTAVYRLTTEVRFSTAGSGLFKTYTLPRAVELSR